MEGKFQRRKKWKKEKDIGIPEEGTPQLLPKQNANFTETHNLLSTTISWSFLLFGNTKTVKKNENL